MMGHILSPPSSRRSPRKALFLKVFIPLLFTLLGSNSYAQTLSTVHTLSGSDGKNIVAGMIQASDSNFYGVASIGGANSLGTVFRLTPAGDYSVIYSFTGGADGDDPTGPLVQGGDGNLYGISEFGGDPSLCTATGGCGTVFRITSSGTLTTLYNFVGGSDGAHPQSGLVQGNDGLFYGTTVAGGDSNNDGTIYKLSQDGTYTQLHVFDGSTEGAKPQGALVEASDGNFYGVTPSGGANDEGTLFRISPSGSFSVLYSFSKEEGAAPASRLFEAAGGLYGTTQRGGDLNDCDAGCGVVFKANLAGTVTSLHRFSGQQDGISPANGLFQAGDGNFYGTTSGKGGCAQDDSEGCGTIFHLSSSGALTTDYRSQGTSDLVASSGELVQGDTGGLWGTTSGSTEVSGLKSSSTLYDFEASPQLAAPVQLSLDHALIAENSSVNLTWKVRNAASTTMQQCYAFIQSAPTGAGTWSGLQRGTLSGTVLSGSTTITPTQDGTYTYALTCGGIESGFATLTVGTQAELVIKTTALPSGIVGVPYSASLAAYGGFGADTWAVLSGGLPQGLVLNAKTGTITGTPTLGGTTNFSVRVEDSQDTPAEATANLTITVRAGTPTVVASVTPTTVLAGESVKIAASVIGISNGKTPGGTVQFQDNGANLGTATVITDGSAVLNAVPFATPGVHSIVAIYSGDTNYSSAASPATSLTVTAPVPNVVITVAPATISAGGNTTLRATISGTPLPTGTVQFQANGSNLGAPATLSSGVATLGNEVFTTAGSYAITATYSGDGNYSSATSDRAALTVSSVDASLTASPPTIIVTAPGKSGTTVLHIKNFFQNTVSFSCSGLPGTTSCSFGSLTGSGLDGTATMQIVTEAPYSSSLRRFDDGSGLQYAAVFPGLLAFLGSVSRWPRRRRLALWGALMCAAAGLICGCGVHFDGTPTGSYTVKVIASSGTQIASTTVVLTVGEN